MSDVDKRIHVDVRIARVPENHAACFILGQNRSDATHIGRKIRWGNCAVLDKLHRAKIWIETSKDGAGCVTKLPKFGLRRPIERDSNRGRSALAKDRFDFTRRGTRTGGVASFDFREQRGLSL